MNLSVIIPVYNQEKYLAQCLDSILIQNAGEFEVICVDDGSTDRSAEILAGYAAADARVKVLTVPHSDAGTARNAGYAAASGEFVTFLDSDDGYAPQMLPEMCKILTENDADIAVCGKSDFSGDFNGFFSDEKTVWETLDNSGNQVNIFEKFYGWPWDKLIRRSLIEKYDLKYQSLFATNDLFFCYAALTMAKKICSTDACFVFHRKHSSSIESNRQKSPLCFMEALKKYYALLREHQLNDRFMQFFHSYVLTFSFWHLNTNPECYEQIYRNMRELFLALDMDKIPSEHISKHRFYRRFCNILNGSGNLSDRLLFGSRPLTGIPRKMVLMTVNLQEKFYRGLQCIAEHGLKVFLKKLRGKIVRRFGKNTGEK